MLHYWLYKIRWYTFIAVLLLGAIFAAKWSSWLDMKLGFKQPRAVSQQQAQPSTQPAPMVPLPSAVQGSATPVLTTTDVHVQLSKANSLLSEASVYASAALEEVLTWQSEVEPLRERAIGEPVAEGSKESEQTKLYDRLAYVMRRERTGATAIGDASTQIETLRRKIDSLIKQASPTALSASEVAEISRLHATCKNAREKWKRDVGQALAIKHLIDLETETLADSPAPTTIGSKIDEADARSAVDDLEEEIKFEEEQQAQERARAAEIEKQRLEQEQREAELLAKATSPEVKALLAPFLEPRTIQPSLAGTFSIRWVRSAEKKPMSLGKLLEIGALDDSVLGLKKLALVVGNRKLPEPKWSIASQPNNWSPEDEERLRQTQQMLREYGPLLVKAGLLSE